MIRRHRRLPLPGQTGSPLRPCRRPVLLAALLALPMAALRADAATYTFSNPAGGALNVASNFTPVGVPGAADTLVLDDLPNLFTNLTLTVPTNQTIGGLQYSHYGQMTLNGPATLTLQNGTIAFTDAITEAPGSPLTSLFINAPITSGTTLTKTGRGFVWLGSTNTAAALSIDAGALLGDTREGRNLGGVSVPADASLGATGAGITLANGGTIRATSGFTTARSLTVNGSVGGRLESAGNLTWNGAVTGTGTLAIGGLGGSIGSGTVTLGGMLSNTGGLAISNGTTATLTGSMSAGNVLLGGTLNLGTSTAGPAANALPDATIVSSSGGNLVIYGRSTSTTESTGTLSLLGGITTIDLNTNVNAGTQFSPSSITRNNRTTLFVRGRDLGGGALTANRALFTPVSTAGLTLIGGGGTTATNASIVPWIVGNASNSGGFNSQISAVEAGLVTLGANGLRALTAADYATTIGASATDNVRVSDGIAVLSNAATVNALVIRDTIGGSGNTGVTGTGQLTVTSGAIVAVSDLQGEELFIDNPLNFGTAEGVIHTLPSADGDPSLTLRGPISGSLGLTKSGNGDLFVTNTASSYAGTTTVDAGAIIFSGDLRAGVNSSLGAGGQITLLPGANGNQYTQLLAATPNSVVERQINVFPESSINDRAVIGTRGGVGTSYNGNIFLGGSLNVLGDADPNNVLSFNGTISNGQGFGALQDPAVAFPALQYLRITGNNTFTGGVTIRGGEWQAGSDTAFGTGVVTFAGNNTATQTGAINAYGGARTLANPLVFRAAPVFNGSNALTFTGSVDLGSVNQQVFVTNSADTTFAGVVGRGGIVKRGGGRLVLSGANTYNGQTIVYEGQLRAASNGALGVAAGTANSGQGTFIVNTGSLELAGGITTSEPIYLGSGAIPISSANPLGNLRSVAGNNTIAESVSFDNVGTVGVDAGSTLTITGDTLDNTTNATAALRKVGAGTLAVKNVRLNTLDIQAGTVRINTNTVPNGTSRVSAINVATGGLLDLTNNSLIYDYTAGNSPLTAVRTLLQQGLIDTTSGGANGAVGYAEAVSYFPTGTSFPQQYAGLQIDNTTLLLTYTLAGDATLDKTVGFDDLLILAKNYNGTGKVWQQGDFDYDGAVDFSDLLMLAKAYNSTAPVSAFTDASFAADWALAQSMVPEPISLGAIVLLMPLARRRRR